MAMDINVGKEKVRRGDVYAVSPDEILVEEGNRGRWKPPSDEKVIEKAESIRTHGQIQPVVARRLKEKKNRLQLVAGFTRVAACRLLRRGYTVTMGDGETVIRPPIPDQIVHVIVRDLSPAKSLIANIEENNERDQTSLMDDAFNQQRLREQALFSEKDIAALYHCSQSWVSQLRDLLDLDEAIQLKVHEGEIGLVQARQLKKLPEEKRMEVVQRSTQEDGHIKGSSITSNVRDEILSDAGKKDEAAPEENTPAEPEAAIPLSITEVRKFVSEESELSENEKVKKLWAAFLKFIQGKRKLQWLRKTVKEIVS